MFWVPGCSLQPGRLSTVSLAVHGRYWGPWLLAAARDACYGFSAVSGGVLGPWLLVAARDALYCSLSGRGGFLGPWPLAAARDVFYGLRRFTAVFWEPGCSLQPGTIPTVPLAAPGGFLVPWLLRAART